MGKFWNAIRALSCCSLPEEPPQPARRAHPARALGSSGPPRDDSRARLAAGAAPRQPFAPPARTAPQAANPLLGSTIVVDPAGSRKQYLFAGQPLFASYPSPGGADTPEAPGAGRRRINGGGHHTIEARRNAAASVHVKKSRYPLQPEDDISARISRLNSLHALLLRDDARPYRRHFAVEIFKCVDTDGRAMYLTPKVPGTAAVASFDLAAFARCTFRHADQLPAGALGEKAAELKKALEWLHRQGWVHGDTRLANIMYDAENECLVLIDFETVDTADPQRVAEELEGFDLEIELALSAQREQLEIRGHRG